MNSNLYCLFTSDLHGNKAKYEKLFSYIEKSPPDAVFLGGDLSASIRDIKENTAEDNLFSSFIMGNLIHLKNQLKDIYPDIFIILGNDDSQLLENEVCKIEKHHLWRYIHQRNINWKGFNLYGYTYIPPSPFLFKDWEKYDVSRYTDPGCVAPEEGLCSRKDSYEERKFSTIKKDLENFAEKNTLKNLILLFHSPPYNTLLDRGDLDGKFFDHVPLDLHIGSIAIYDFLEKYQPLISLHGHIHESTRLTGSWKDKIGTTFCFNAAHDGLELSMISFNPANPGSAVRILI
jgi:uncharacterized protein